MPILTMILKKKEKSHWYDICENTFKRKKNTVKKLNTQCHLMTQTNKHFGQHNIWNNHRIYHRINIKAVIKYTCKM